MFTHTYACTQIRAHTHTHINAHQRVHAYAHVLIRTHTNDSPQVRYYADCTFTSCVRMEEKLLRRFTAIALAHQEASKESDSHEKHSDSRMAAP